jgi:hypothetical protein
LQDIQRIAILIREPRDCWEGLRSGLGLGVENLWAGCFIIDCEIELLPGKSDEDLTENLEMLLELEAGLFTNVRANSERFPQIEYLPLEAMPEKIKEYQLVVPF